MLRTIARRITCSVPRVAARSSFFCAPAAGRFSFVSNRISSLRTSSHLVQRLGLAVTKRRIGTSTLALQRKPFRFQPIPVQQARNSSFQSLRTSAEQSSGSTGWMLAGGAALLGLGAIFYWGSKIETEVGPVDSVRVSLPTTPGAAALLPAYARERLHSTYKYVLGGLAITAATATLFFRTGLAYRLGALSPMAVLGVSLVGTLGSLFALMATDYHQSPLLKHGLFVLYNAATGLTLCPLGLLGGALLLKAAAATAATVGALSVTAMAAPSESFLQLSGPLTVGLGVVLAASVGQLFFPASPLLYNVTLYGGLAVFSGFMLYDTQRIMQRAQQHKDAPYDPVNESLAVYLNVLNIFLRMVQVFATSQQRKR